MASDDRERRGLKVRFFPPESGWLALVVSDGELGCAITCSNVPNDFVHELLGALSLAVLGVEGRAIADAEPTVFEFVVSPPDANGESSLAIHEFPSLKPHRRDGATIPDREARRVARSRETPLRLDEAP